MRILKENCTGLIIDIQERLFPHMYQKEALIERCTILIQGLAVLEVPMLITEQYPRGLGSTLDEIKSLIQPFNPIEKIAFSCCDEPAYKRELDQTGRQTVLICGIEAHVCVQQTVIDLLETRFLPVVMADCVSSRSAADRDVALQRMSSEGAVISTSESILFELARVAGTATFKTISKLVK